MRQATNPTQTLVNIITAMDAQRAVTIRYVKADGTVSRRAIEIHLIRVSEAGDIVIECFDRRSGTRHTFRLDRITAYTLHRLPRLAAYRQPVVADAAPVVDRDTDEPVGFRAYALAA